jgi:RimJ/RimL family protein N-acetyltransferase
VIRTSTPGDCPALARLLNAVAAEGDVVIAQPGDGNSVGETVALAALLGSGGISLTLEVEDTVAGRVMVQRGALAHERHTGELAIAVGAAFRGEGMGRALVGAAVKWARAAGIERLALRVFPSNARAIRVYRGAGFVEEGVLRRAVSMPDGHRDLLVMSLLL